MGRKRPPGARPRTPTVRKGNHDSEFMMWLAAGMIPVVDCPDERRFDVQGAADRWLHKFGIDTGMLLLLNGGGPRAMLLVGGVSLRVAGELHAHLMTHPQHRAWDVAEVMW